MLTAKQSLKGLGSLILSQAPVSIVVNSFGRSGSTLLHEAAVDSALRGARPGPARRLLRSFEWDLEGADFGPRQIVKTHDYPHESMPSNAKYFYVFGDPVTSTMSAYRLAQEDPSWWVEHCEHMKVAYCDPGDVLVKDALSIEAHFCSWLDQEKASVAFVRFEALWDLETQISEFAGFEVKLPPRRARRSDRSESSVRTQAVYSQMTRKVDSLPDWFMRGRKN